MDRFTAYRELKGHLDEASAEMSMKWVALMTDCHISTVRAWQERKTCSLHTRTIQRVLPRIRRWRDWLPHYEAVLDETEQLWNYPPSAESLVSELAERLDVAEGLLSPSQIANLCEVCESRLMRWRFGLYSDDQLPLMLHALGRIRHLERCVGALARQEELAS